MDNIRLLVYLICVQHRPWNRREVNVVTYIFDKLCEFILVLNNIFKQQFKWLLYLLYCGTLHPLYLPWCISCLYSTNTTFLCRNSRSEDKERGRDRGGERNRERDREDSSSWDGAGMSRRYRERSRSGERDKDRSRERERRRARYLWIVSDPLIYSFLL